MLFVMKVEIFPTLLVYFSDVTARKKSEAELRKLANSDTLTGLPNRSFFQANQANLVKKQNTTCPTCF